jgi:hypothetical protein
MVFSYHTIILFHLNDLIKQQVLPPPPPPPRLPVSNPPARPPSLPSFLLSLNSLYLSWHGCSGSVTDRFFCFCTLPAAQVAAREKRSIATLLLAAALIGIVPHH